MGQTLMDAVTLAGVCGGVVGGAVVFCFVALMDLARDAFLAARARRAVPASRKAAL